MSEKRQESRMSLNLPVRVSGFRRDGSPWEEMTTSGDASRHGASFVLQQPVERGEILLLMLPLPKKFRSHDINEASYKVYGLVRNVKAIDETLGNVGVLFLGKNPPRDYQNNPGMRYLLPSDPAPKEKDRRQQERRTVFVTLRLTRLDASGREELTVAEDLSAGGSRVPTSLPVSVGEVLMIEELGGDFRSRAEVRNLFVGDDHVVRLNLRFLDGSPPDRLLA